MADENPEAPAPETPPKSRFAWPGGYVGWLIVLGVTLVEAAFFIYFMVIREPGAVPEPEQAKAFLEDTAILQSRVEINNFSATVSAPGGDLRPINFNLVLELHYLPEEKRPGAARPTPAQIEVFRTVVVQLESKIRDHLNTFLTVQSFANLASGRGPDLVKSEVMRFVNNELEKFDFSAQKIPENISRRRVTNVLLPSWTLM